MNHFRHQLKIFSFFSCLLFFFMQGCQRNQSVSSLKLSEPVSLRPPDSSQLIKEDLTIGQGKEAIDGKKISVHYTGWLIDNTKFDSSLDRQAPFEFVLGSHQVIIGWEQGLLGMKEGGKRKLTIPPSLAYGDQPIGKIPAHSTLIFEISLIKVFDE